MPKLLPGNRGSGQISTASPNVTLPGGFGQEALRAQKDFTNSLGSAFGEYHGYKERVDAIDTQRQTIEGRIAYTEAMSQYESTMLGNKEYTKHGKWWAEKSKAVTAEINARITNPNALRDFNNYSRVETAAGTAATKRKAAMDMISDANANIVPFTQVEANKASKNPNAKVRASMRDEYIAELNLMAATAQISTDQADAYVLRYDSLIASSDASNRQAIEESKRAVILETMAAIKDPQEAQEMGLKMGLSMGLSNSMINWLQSQDKASRESAVAQKKVDQETTTDKLHRLTTQGKMTGEWLLKEREAGNITHDQFEGLKKSLFHKVEDDDPVALSKIDRAANKVGSSAASLSEARAVYNELSPFLTNETKGRMLEKINRELDTMQDTAFGHARSEAEKQILKTRESDIEAMMRRVETMAESDEKANAKDVLKGKQEEYELLSQQLNRWSLAMDGFRASKRGQDAARQDILEEGKRLWLDQFDLSIEQLRKVRVREKLAASEATRKITAAAAAKKAAAEAKDAALLDKVTKEIAEDLTNGKMGEEIKIEVEKGGKRPLSIEEKMVDIILPNGQAAQIPMMNLKKAEALGARRKK